MIASSSVHDNRQFSSINTFIFWMLGPAEVETGLPGDFPLESSKHPFSISAIQRHIVWSDGQVSLLDPF